MKETKYSSALVAGGAAGLSVDLALFPLDTIKTRLQSPQGFLQAGGFRGVYAGIASAAAGSIPGAALFFGTYETVKSVLSKHGKTSENMLPFIHMVAASTGEVTACLVRVPCEVVKQRAQAESSFTTKQHAIRTFKSEGFLGFYRGYLSTVIREVPFSLIQFPLWEYIKLQWSRTQGCDVLPWQSAVAGSAAGAIAAAVTTPLDVAKTHIMLAKAGSKTATGNIGSVLMLVFQEKGFQGLFAGLIPRVMWISVGGFIFLGVYSKTCHTLENYY